ncbi:RING-H2 finger protein ATL56-like [Salvia splendens]|uniref:RING-H2 finger protein ATL56-like n=1 Tax=Salvia splendens TaxID=180675 RepID=UPI001C264AA4|nr:RING-H2 finger protein ATL56-like [Salvia splendens]
MGSISKLLSYPNKILSTFLFQTLPKLIYLSLLALCVFLKHYQIFTRRRSYAAAVKSTRRKLPDCGECSICLVGFAEGGECCELDACGHSFHRRCVETWLRGSIPTCPLCRAAVFPEAEVEEAELEKEEKDWIEKKFALALLNVLDRGGCNVNGYF